MVGLLSGERGITPALCQSTPTRSRLTGKPDKWSWLAFQPVAYKANDKSAPLTRTRSQLETCIGGMQIELHEATVLVKNKHDLDGLVHKQRAPCATLDRSDHWGIAIKFAQVRIIRSTPHRGVFQVLSIEKLHHRRGRRPDVYIVLHESSKRFRPSCSHAIVCEISCDRHT